MPAGKSGPGKAKKIQKSPAKKKAPAKKTASARAASRPRATSAKKKGTVKTKKVSTSPKAKKKTTTKKRKPPAASPPSPFLGMSRGYVKALAEYEKAMGAFHRREFDRAISLFQKIIDLYSTDADELADRSRVYINTCRKQVEGDAQPQGFEEHYNQGIYHSNRGDYAAAIEVLRKALKLEPESGKAHYAMAAALAQHGELAASLQHLRRAVAADRANRLLAKRDGDLEPLHGDPEFQDLIDVAAQPAPA